MKQTLEMIDLKLIKPNPFQPRKEFDEEKLKSLADSIASEGLLQPIVVLKDDGNTFTIVGGERRFKAHQILGEKEIQAKIIEDVEDRIKFLRNGGVIENTQRENLTVQEQIETIVFLKDEQKMNHDEIAKLFGHEKTWSQIRYELSKNKNFTEMLFKGETHVAWWEGIRPFLNYYPELEKDLFNALIKKRWTNKSTLRDFAHECHSQDLPTEVVRGIVLYPTIFTKKVLEKLNELSIEEKKCAAHFFIQAHEESEEYQITDSMIIEYVNNLLQKKERTKKISNLRELLAQEEKEQEEKLNVLEQEYQIKTSEIRKKAEAEFKKKKSLLETKMANVVTDGEVTLTEEQEMQLKKLEEDYNKKKEDYEKQKQKRIEETQKRYAENLVKVEMKIKELEKQWATEKYHNPIRDGIDTVLSSLFTSEGLVGNFVNLDLQFIIEEMPQDEFEHIQRSVESILNYLDIVRPTFEKINSLTQNRLANPIKVVKDRAEQKAKFQVVQKQVNENS